MIKLLLLIAFTYSIAWIPFIKCLNLLGDENIALYIRDIQYCILISYAYELIPKKEIAIRSIIISWFIFCVIEAQQYYILQYKPDIYFNVYLITMGIIATTLIYNLLKPNNNLLNYRTCLQKGL